MFAEEDLVPLSAVQHMLFCERQCALIHIEQRWAENRLTAEGRIMHERAHKGGTESRGDVKTEFGVTVRSLRFGLIGKADVVEFHRKSVGAKPGDGARKWTPFPVEYKRGKPKPNRCDEVQLCAQALCLEEMLGCSIPAGSIFYGLPRRRMEVIIDDSLREETQKTIARLHELIADGSTPKAEFSKRCRNCSLLNECMPKKKSSKSVSRYYAELFSECASE